MPELCKNYQPGKTEDINARLSRIEQIIELALPQFANAEYILPLSPRDPGSFSGGLPDGNWQDGSGSTSGLQAMDVDGNQNRDGLKSASSSRSNSPKPETHGPSGGSLESGKWFGTSALGSVNMRPIIEQVSSPMGRSAPAHLSASYKSPLVETMPSLILKIKLKRPINSRA